MAKDIFTLITPSVLKARSTEEAELAKLYCNTYRDMNFAIGNAFCLAAQTFGQEWPSRAGRRRAIYAAHHQ